jgi:hypothetical protein
MSTESSIATLELVYTVTANLEFSQLKATGILRCCTKKAQEKSVAWFSVEWNSNA